MKSGTGIVVAACLMALALVALGCSGASTVTQPGVTVIQPGVAVTITVTGGVTTVPAATVTLPGKVTTIPAVTVTIPPVVITSTPIPEGVDLLPNTPIQITTHMAALADALKGQCLQCHGPGAYNQYPLPPSWDGASYNSTTHNGVYNVISGSIQDHSNRGADVCLTCHVVVR
jgi:hypothetical protein